MTRAFYRICAALLCATALAAPLSARAAFMVDPEKLYREMKTAYQTGMAQGWTFYNQEYYLATIFNAGRAYSLQRPDDPAYPQLMQATVDIATGVHYDPLVNHEAVPWYVREAAVYVSRHNSDPAEVAKAEALLERVDALENPQKLAQLADQDAAANVTQYPHDANALLQQVEANWRGWLITKDPKWRALALVHAVSPDFPIANLPTTWGPAFLDAVKAAGAGDAGYSSAETDNAQLIEARIAKLPTMKTIESLKSRPSHALQMTTLAPADEYFGPLKMSILGIRNELGRINYMIGYGYTYQESKMAIDLAVAIDDLHKVYPRDRDLPQLLYDICTTLGKVHTSDADAARTHMKSILTIEYPDTKQAQKLLGSS